MNTVTLSGFHLSVYTRAAQMALVAKGVRFERAEFNPFDQDDLARLKRLHPFGRVPVLDHDGFRLWETQAILGYVDEAFYDLSLTPANARERARMRQVMGIVDSYLYWPLVRQVFSQRVFQPLLGEVPDEDSIRDGLDKAGPVLDALEKIAEEGLVLVPGRLDQSGCLLWPMLDYFRMAPEGAGMLEARPGLARWCTWVESCPEAKTTRPDLPKGGTA